MLNQVFTAAPAATVLDVCQPLATAEICTIALLNLTAAVAYLQIFNVAAADVTLGTTVPVAQIGLPASGALVVDLPGIWHVAGGKGVSVAGTTLPTGTVGAAIRVNIWFGA